MNETMENITEQLSEETNEELIPEEPVAEAPEEAAPLSADDARALKEELESLKLQLEESRSMYNRLHGECMEFSSLYPDVPLSTIPDSIWGSVRSGVPLAAAYALAEKKERMAREKAIDVNSKNHERSSGALSASKTEEFFTPAEVRAMSAAEVRANYAKIITSMSKWH